MKKWLKRELYILQKQLKARYRQRIEADSSYIEMKRAFMKFCSKQNDARNRSVKFPILKSGVGKEILLETSEIREIFQIKEPAISQIKKSIRNYNFILGIIHPRSLKQRTKYRINFYSSRS